MTTGLLVIDLQRACSPQTRHPMRAMRCCPGSRICSSGRGHAEFSCSMFLGYEVVLVQDGHTTFDTPVLSAAQIVEHHNQTLKGSFVDLTKAKAVTL